MAPQLPDLSIAAVMAIEEVAKHAHQLFFLMDLKQTAEEYNLDFENSRAFCQQRIDLTKSIAVITYRLKLTHLKHCRVDEDKKRCIIHFSSKNENFHMFLWFKREDTPMKRINDLFSQIINFVRSNDDIKTSGAIANIERNGNILSIFIERIRINNS